MPEKFAVFVTQMKRCINKHNILNQKRNHNKILYGFLKNAYLRENSLLFVLYFQPIFRVKTALYLVY